MAGMQGPTLRIVRYLVTDNGAAGSVHDEPNIRLHITNFDIGFSSGKYTVCFIAIAIDKRLRFDVDSSCLVVVGSLMIRDVDVIKVF